MLCGWKYKNEDLACFEFISKNKENCVPSLLSHLSGLTFCSRINKDSHVAAVYAQENLKNHVSFNWVPLSVKLATRVTSEKILSRTKSFAYARGGSLSHVNSNFNGKMHSSNSFEFGFLADHREKAN